MNTLAPEERTKSPAMTIPLVIGIAFLMEQLDSTIVVTALPAMAQNLHTTVLALNGVVTFYLLALAVGIPASSWAADRFGARRVFALAIGIFTISSGLCGLAGNVIWLETARALQGFAGALMIPVGRIILVRLFPGRDLAHAINWMTLPVVIGPALGPVLGGVIATYSSWRWIFYVNLPIGVLGLVATLRLLPHLPGQAGLRFDLPGFALTGGGLILLQLTLDPASGFGALAGRGLAAVAAAALLLIYARYSYGRHDVALDLSAFGIAAFRISTLAGGLSRIGINAAPFLLPLLFQLGLGYTALASGLMTFGAALGSLGTKYIGPRLLRRFGFARLLQGNALLAAAWIAGFALFGTHVSPFLMFAYIVAFGAIRTIQLTTTNSLAFADIPPDRVSAYVSLAAVLQQLTMSLGVALSATILAVIAPPDYRVSAGSFRIAFLMMALLPLASILGFRHLRADHGSDVSGHAPRKRTISALVTSDDR